MSKVTAFLITKCLQFLIHTKKEVKLSIQLNGQHPPYIYHYSYPLILYQLWLPPSPLCGRQGFCSGSVWFTCAWLSSLFTWHVKLAICRATVAHVNYFGGPWDLTKATINMAQTGKGNCDMKWFTSHYL
jgi:hypothetical protein